LLVYFDVRGARLQRSAENMEMLVLVWPGGHSSPADPFTMPQVDGK
jgi:hypothetical protein